MQDAITATSRAAIEYCVTWQEGDICHHDCYFAELVNFWRDIIDMRLINQLTGATKGDRGKITIPAAEFLAPYSENKKLSIHRRQMQTIDDKGGAIPLVEGRFYPQRLLRQVDGVFRETITPFRLLAVQDDSLLIDLNHPLAGHNLTLEATVQYIHPQARERGGRCEHWLERICSDGPGMQTTLTPHLVSWLSAHALRRIDENPDRDFYRRPRLVHHLDGAARAKLTEMYGKLIKPGEKILDLMASWHSHLPDQLAPGDLTVLGLNEEELQANQRATSFQVQDLNEVPRLSFPDASFDVVLITAAIEYLTDPMTTMHEVARILRPGGTLAIAFSNRWFPPKAIRIWQELHDFQRLGLISGMMEATQAFTDITTYSRRGSGKMPMANDESQSIGDPLFIVWGNRVKKQ